MYLRYKQKLILGITLIVIAILILSSVFVYYEYFEDEEDDNEDEPVTEEIDDRISPLAEQTVSLEIHRIRKRGIEDVMRRTGRSWKEQPSFHFEVTLNDATLTGETITGWDTDYVSWEPFRDIDNETEQCNIDFKIIETTGKLLSTIEDEVSSFSITYDFKTGRWTGDDSFDDSDGYGHFIDENYEIWFEVHMSDNDGDGIPYWTENNILGTNPFVDDSKLDPDNDGIPTTWEWKWGYDPFIFDNHSTLDPDLDGLQNTEEYMMEKWLANPYQPEIYIEVDFMKGKTFGPDYVLWEEAQQLVIDKFSQHNYEKLNYSNTISVHFDDGSMGDGGELLDHVGRYIDQAEGKASEYYKYNFADERKGVFRYLVMAYDAGWNHPQDYKGWYDVMCIGASQKFLTEGFRGRSISPRLQRLTQSIQVLHELGHSLKLLPDHSEGIDNISSDAVYEWNNYMSSMNYYKMYRTLPIARIFSGKTDGLILDYSDGSRDEPGYPDRDDWGYIDLTFFQTPSHMVEGIEVNEEGLPINYRECAI